ncbi:polypeptide N-acetylgalactosaminyltransferase 3 [Condylostylus longicornis]|uniref:polypeptide N-acetylgalactosaminyltransferase 3 n=1 Tax=Condylostylus longicornis TaxID=2530218 RepID=UPI00244E4B70|nr:polypeptide N-acetylgalactosaminyltransferase 3 [Condylostylus longicornis]
MGYTYRKLKKLWILYLFLLFFSFFMFAICINIYLQNLEEWQNNEKKWELEYKSRQKPIQNVVAHYIGTGNIFGNMTKDDYSTSNFKPIDTEGELGKPVIIPARESFKMQRLFKINSFNLLASDRIPLNRTLKDYRTSGCQLRQYDTDLPKTSVIIVFHNEAWSVLLRTIWSVINRSPLHLIKEILLIDDASDREYLKDELENYIVNFPVKVKILRMKVRKGLVPARLKGANVATGDVLTFLDAHCECTTGWLEPMLHRIKHNRKSVICPVIDIISDDNFGFSKVFENHWGGFNWQLSFRWFAVGRKENEKITNDISEPISTPAMAGGLFSIDRKYFFEIGSYDPDMKIWGGENIEMSLRVWQCGGIVEISPCSHVGHLFRKSTPYTFPGGMDKILGENLARAALAWMDDWSDFFFLYNPSAMQFRKTLNVTKRLQLREKMSCKSFSWYLENVWPTHFFPAPDRFFGKIVWLNDKTVLSTVYNSLINKIPGKFAPRKWSDIFDLLWLNIDTLLNSLNFDDDKCLRLDGEDGTYGGASFVSSGILGNCLPTEKLQDMFVITTEGHVMTNDNFCLDAYSKKPDSDPSNGSNVRLFYCHDTKRQYWDYNIMTQQIVHKTHKTCLTVGDEKDGKYQIKAEKCSDGDEILQKWALIPLPWRI